MFLGEAVEATTHSNTLKYTHTRHNVYTEGHEGEHRGEGAGKRERERKRAREWERKRERENGDCAHVGGTPEIEFQRVGVGTGRRSPRVISGFVENEAAAEGTGEFHAGKSTLPDNEPSRIISLPWHTEKAGMNLRSRHPRCNCITVEDAAVGLLAG